jgi:hypothetical protein
VILGVRVAGLFVLGAFAALASLYAADRYRAPDQAALLPPVFPSPPEPLRARIGQLVTESDGRSTPELIELGRRMLRVAPLEAAPLILAADDALRRQELPRAREAMAQAVVRNPRNALLQTWLAEDAAAQGDLAGAVMRLQTLIRLEPNNRSRYIAALTATANQTAGQRLVEELLAADQPPWAPQLVADLNRAHADTSFLIRINRRTPTTQSQLLERVLREKGIGEAYRAWRVLLGESTPRAMDWPYDPTFKGLPGAAPFNWKLLNPKATIEASGGLFTSHDGRGHVNLAEQIVLVRPGKHVLAVEARSEAETKGARLELSLACLGASGQLASIELAETNRGFERSTTVLVVPEESCEGQRLVISGAPGEYVRPIRTEIRSVRIYGSGEVLP